MGLLDKIFKKNESIRCCICTEQNLELDLFKGSITNRAIRCNHCGKIYCGFCWMMTAKKLRKCVSCYGDINDMSLIAYSGDGSYLTTSIKDVMGTGKNAEPLIAGTPMRFENYDEEKLEEIKKINQENWERAQAAIRKNSKK